jgi:RNA polymerase sigma-70 factor (ECF subfamily)
VFAALRRLGVSRLADREDLAQEVYLVVHRKLPGRKNEVPELVWVLTITRKVTRNHHRRLCTQQEKLMDDPEVGQEIADPVPTAEGVLEGRGWYLALVGTLSPERRMVFEFCEIEGFTAPETAAALGISEPTVHSRLRHAREDLRAASQRMRAGEAHASTRRPAAAMLLPFGVGAWQQLRDPADAVTPEVVERVWRGIQRGIVRDAVLADLDADGTLSGMASAAAAAKASGGALFGGGFVLGGVVVAVAMLLLRSPRPAPPAPPVLPEVHAVAGAVGGTASPSSGPTPEPMASTAAGAPSTAGSASIVSHPAPASATLLATTTATVAASQIDPEELALITRAQTAFVRMDRVETLAALAAHVHKFPKGSFARARADIRAKFNEVAKVPGSWASGTTNKPGTSAPGRGGPRFGSDE